jgi:hypothetical protein
MAKDQKPREPTWHERAAALTKVAAYTEHDGEPRTRPIPGKLARLDDRDIVLIVYDMRTRVWASDAEKALYEAAGSQAHGAARPARIAGAISMGVEYVVRDINAKGGTAYRIPPRSKLKWWRGTPPAPPKRERSNEPGCTTFKVGLRIVARCSSCWAAGRYEHAASEHNTMSEADIWAANHRCKT